MSVVSLADGTKSSVSVNILRDVATKNNIKIPAGPEEEIYLLLLQSADAVITSINNSPDYIDPRLLPQSVVGRDRKYWKPTAAENPLNGWSHRCEFSAEKPTSDALKGRTVVLKDNVSVAGLPTTLGTFQQFHKDGRYPIAAIDAPIVSRLLSAGATILGTSVCENYSACPLSYSSASGPVHNAWKRGYNTGGSSSGAGALVSANIVKEIQGETAGDFGVLPQLAIGGDQGGSIRLPASYAGIYGLKATHGLIPYTGIASLYPMLDHTGPMAKNIMDIAVLLSVLAGYDGLDPRMTPESPLRANVMDYAYLLSSFTDRPLADGEMIGSTLRIGIVKEGLEVPGLDPAVRDRIHSAATKSFGAVGSTVSEVSIPIHAHGAAIWTAATRYALADSGMRGSTPSVLGHGLPHISMRWPPDQEMYDLLSAVNPASVNMMFVGTFLGEKYGPEVVAKAHRKVLELRAAYDNALGEYDVLITPVTPTVAMPHPSLSFTLGEGSTVREKIMLAVGSTANTCPFNVTGHPAISVPCGFLPADDGDELPIGMQIVARRWDEETLLKAAAVFEIGQKV